MRLALNLADKAAMAGEVPVGAIVVNAQAEIIGSGFNQVISNHDPSAHAEIMAVRQACLSQGNYRLPGASLYVTLEPCIMCMGAIFHTRIARVVFGAYDPKTGACGSVLALNEKSTINHHTQVYGGVLQDECSARLKSFFAQRRLQHKTS